MTHQTDPKTIGVLGAGQLGRMLALAGYPLGLKFRFFDDIAETPASVLAPQVTASFEDTDGLDAFASGLNCVTYEFENIPVATVQFLEKKLPVFPSSKVLEISQDRIFEKEFFRRLNIPTPRFVKVDNFQELEAAATSIGFPSRLKTRRLGYDGKGQFVLNSSDDLQKAWDTVGAKNKGGGCELEEGVSFEREVSLIGVRSRSGATAFYPLIENHHKEGILRFSFLPAPETTETLQSLAETYLLKIFDALNYVGVLTVEFFQKEGRLIANEMAPRVHNSGHGTIEGAETSQFENHLRACLDLPLGSTAPRGHSIMMNLIGSIPDLSSFYTTPGAHVHLYGKTPLDRRKLGHVTLRDDDWERLQVFLFSKPVA